MIQKTAKTSDKDGVQGLSILIIEWQEKIFFHFVKLQVGLCQA
jgi:hypothetical protein